jgi:hypothetical protein
VPCSYGQNFILASVIDFESVKIFKNRSDVMKFMTSGDSMSSGIVTQLDTIILVEGRF